MSSSASPDKGARGFALRAFAIRVSAAAVAFLMQVALARIIGEEDYGRVAAAMTMVLIATALATVGLDAVAQRFIPSYLARRDLDGVRGFVSGARKVSLIGGLVVGIGGAAAMAPLDGVVALMLLCVPLLALMAVQEGVAKAFDWPVVALSPNYLLRPLGVLLILGFLLLLGLSVDAYTVVVAMVAATAIALAIQWGLMRPRIAAEVPTGPASRDMRLWLTVSSPVLIGNLGSIVMLSADVIALWLFVGASQAGIYFAAIKSLVLVQFVAYAVANASAHRVAALHAREEHDELRRFVLRACVMTFLPSLAIAVALVGLGPFILALFGDAFVEGWPAMVIVACGYLVVAAVGPAERVLYMIGAERACARVYLACGAAAIALNLVLVPLYGIMGAASALAMVLVLEAALLAILLRSHLRRPATRHREALAGPERVENAPVG